VSLRSKALSVDVARKLSALDGGDGVNTRSVLWNFSFLLGLSDLPFFVQKASSSADNKILNIQGLSAMLANTGWSKAEALLGAEDSDLNADEFFLEILVVASFEAEEWKRAQMQQQQFQPSSHPTCIMHSGYMSSWLSRTVGTQLAAFEVDCSAMSESSHHHMCRFIVAPPVNLEKHLQKYLARKGNDLHATELLQYLSEFASLSSSASLLTK